MDPINVNPFEPDEPTKRKPLKSELIRKAAGTLGIAQEFAFSGGGLAQTLKELAVFCGAAESPSEIPARTIGEVLQFIAENGEIIVKPPEQPFISRDGVGQVKITNSTGYKMPVSCLFGGGGTLRYAEKDVSIGNTETFIAPLNSNGSAISGNFSIRINWSYEARRLKITGAEYTPKITPIDKSTNSTTYLVELTGISTEKNVNLTATLEQVTT